MDLDARVVERWRPEDTRPEVLDHTLSWTPRERGEPLSIDVMAFFVDLVE